MSDTTSTIKEFGRDARDKAQEMAQEARHQAHDAAIAKGEKVRSAALSEVDEAARAAHAAEQEFDPNSLQAAALRQVSAAIEDVGEKLRGRQVEDLVDDVARFARKNPALFLAGAALAGFAMARFLKARPPQATARRDDDIWEGHLSDGRPAVGHQASRSVS